MKEYKGLLHGHFETGTEGIMPAIQEYEHISEDGSSWSYAGLQVIDPGDHLIIIRDGVELFKGKLKCVMWGIDGIEGCVLIDEPDIKASWERYPFYPENGQLQINGCWVHYLPKNVDLRLWWDVFFKNDGKYDGVLKKK